MTTSQTTDAYIGFLKIEERAFAEKIRFFEENQGALIYLPEEEKFELHIAYLIALFEVGEYDKYLSLADRAIEEVFEENIFIYKNRDLVQELVFRKACALHNTSKSKEAIRIASQLYRMYPEKLQNRQLLKKTTSILISGKLQKLKAWSIGLYLSCGLLIAAHLFIIQPFYMQYSYTSMLIWQSLFVVASLLLLAGELFVRIAANKKADEALKSKN